MRKFQRMRAITLRIIRQFFKHVKKKRVSLKTRLKDWKRIKLRTKPKRPSRAMSDNRTINTVKKVTSKIIKS